VTKFTDNSRFFQFELIIRKQRMFKLFDCVIRLTVYSQGRRRTDRHLAVQGVESNTPVGPLVAASHWAQHHSWRYHHRSTSAHRRTKLDRRLVALALSGRQCYVVLDPVDDRWWSAVSGNAVECNRTGCVDRLRHRADEKRRANIWRINENNEESFLGKLSLTMFVTSRKLLRMCLLCLSRTLIVDCLI
jgi:hypothetical protein